MTFDAKNEYGNIISSEDYMSGRDFIDAIIADAKKVLPPNTDYWFITWDEGGKRKAGWVFNLQTPRDKQKLFNPLKPGEPLRT